MRTKKTLIKCIIFGVLAAALLGIGGALGLWKTDEIAGKLNFSWATVARIGIIIFATLFVENLLVFLLSLPKPENHRVRTALALTSNVIKYAAAIVILCGVLAILSVDIGTILAGLGIVALIIGFGAESLIADIEALTFVNGCGERIPAEGLTAAVDGKDLCYTGTLQVYNTDEALSLCFLVIGDDAWLLG